MTHTHHTLDYVELAAPDVAAAKEFYAAALGWAFNDYGPEYAGIRSADGTDEVGGLTAAATPSTAGVLALVYSEDVDASLQAVQAAGGTVTDPVFEYPGGRRFHFVDPAGNRLGVYQPAG
jgi:predicted enzyme related to lactoylglutathione lyase